MLDALEQGILVAVDRLTRETYGHTHGLAVAGELDHMGSATPDVTLSNALQSLERHGYLEAQVALAGGAAGFRLLRLTSRGRTEARQADPFERIHGEARHAIASADFARRYPDAFEAWAAAEKLLWEARTTTNLTTIGHRVREGMQAFATALVDAHQPPNVDPSPTNVKKRIGAVIAMHRPLLGDARREVLEALGTLWNKTIDLVQRQEHGAQKEGEPVTWSDARRVVWLTMFCMAELAETFN